MPRPAYWRLVCLLVICLLNRQKALAQLRAGESAPRFSLADQFGQTTTLDFPVNTPVIIVFAGRSGRAEAQQWVTALLQVTRPVRLLTVACTGWVPKLLQGVVRRAFAEAKPILINWNNRVADSYGFGQTTCRLVVLTGIGHVIIVDDGPYSPKRLTAVVHAITQLQANN
ncbi:hypothetical protein J2I47_05295 [Fibrella sp. HMF5335]|uniref:Thioredoxin domain-containing protein n=1 Tax=Fibrella rubiginis TaxID=2817060 RepID=A0A939GEW3_9BACT|nr:hypothetical protein [Fibrella rubiginis]MBO0935954.1 hypothetical protein [Fibrella rubiginis]